MKKWIIALIGWMPVCLLADGFIIPEPGINMAVKYHHVTVTIQNQVAHTEVDQVFLMIQMWTALRPSMCSLCPKGQPSPFHPLCGRRTHGS